MSITSRLAAFVAAAIITAVSFAGPTLASPNSATHHIVSPSTAR